MLPHDSLNRLLKAICLTGALLTPVVFPSCIQTKSTREIAGKPMPADSLRYHADNDIAMTVRSLADALKVGEPLDSTQYDYEGVLTDGQGSPLYFDVEGAPGMWKVDVLDKKSVLIQNLYLGDLLPIDLQSYILQTLRVPSERRLLPPAHEETTDEENDTVLYDCDGVYLKFEVKSGIAPNGLEGPMLNIIMSADPPVLAETQTNV